MIRLIIGNRGSGKTKRLLECVNTALENSEGNVVCIEKERLLTYNVNYRARLVETDHFGIQGYDAFYGFLCGICASDHDITDVLVDATLRIGGRDYEALAKFLAQLNALEEMREKNLTFTVSADREELPESIFALCEVL